MSPNASTTKQGRGTATSSDQKAADSLTRFRDRLSLPLIAAPMFLVSGVDLVVAACRNGVIGAFRRLNCRSPEQLDGWLGDIETRLRRHSDASGKTCRPDLPEPDRAPFHARLARDLQVLLRHRPEIVITSVGSPAPVLAALHDAGSIGIRRCRQHPPRERAVEAGADGLVLLTAGAGGQTGWLNPFVFVRAVRAFFDGPVVLAGGIGDGHALRAAQALRLRSRLYGTKFIATRESLADVRYKEMLVASSGRRYPADHGLHRPADQYAAAFHRRRGLDPTTCRNAAPSTSARTSTSAPATNAPRAGAISGARGIPRRAYRGVVGRRSRRAAPSPSIATAKNTKRR